MIKKVLLKSEKHIKCLPWPRVEKVKSKHLKLENKLENGIELEFCRLDSKRERHQQSKVNHYGHWVFVVYADAEFFVKTFMKWSSFMKWTSGLRIRHGLRIWHGLRIRNGMYDRRGNCLRVRHGHGLRVRHGVRHGVSVRRGRSGLRVRLDSHIQHIYYLLHLESKYSDINAISVIGGNSDTSDDTSRYIYEQMPQA